MISMNNAGGRNYGGKGTIKSIDNNGKVLEEVYNADNVDDDY